MYEEYLSILQNLLIVIQNNNYKRKNDISIK